MIDATHSAVLSSPVRDFEEVPYIDRSRPMVQVSAGDPGSMKDRLWAVLLATFIAALGPLNFGYTLGFTSPVEEEMESDNTLPLTKAEFSWFAALVGIGAIGGAVIGGWAIDYFGRKTTLLLCSVPFALGWLLISYAETKSMLYIGRTLTGIAVGCTSLTVPVYIAEISSARLRGGLGTVNQLAVVTGICLAYSVGYKASWRWTAMAAVFTIVLLVMLMVFMPETPRWLLAANLRHKALRELSWLRGPNYDVEEECFQIESNLDLQEKLTFRELFQPQLRRPLAISCLLMIFQQFSGVNAILFYASNIFKTAGFSDDKLVSIGLAGAQILATGAACLIVDRCGRRILLMVGGVGMAISNALLGVYYEIAIISGDGGKGAKAASTLHAIAHSVPQHQISWLAVTSTVVFIVMFSLGWGPLPWVVMSEIFPPRARGLASGISTLVNWLFVFVVTKTFTNLIKAFTTQGAFWFFAAWCFLSVLYVYFFVPETKGKTLEEIESHMSRINLPEEDK